MSRESDQVENRREGAGQEVDAPGSSEDPDSDQDRNEIGEDAEGDLDSFLGPLDELIVNSHTPQGCIKREEADQKWNGHQGDGLDQ